MTADDPRIAALREELAATDRRILQAVNARLELVERLRRVKEELGVDFLDPAREEWLQQHLAERNQGPLSAEGLRAFYAELLALTKREVGGGL
ncbi:MAG TPA: chorismate mutase [Gaiellaceae bacterium]|nr:chorismate mutase [Gaiellaceae bacterium]